MVQSFLGVGEVLVGGDNISFERWSEVVVGVLRYVMPLGLRLLSSHNKLVLGDSFSNI